jgi:tetratricopeptide (TPR) repeat protein
MSPAMNKLFNTAKPITDYKDSLKLARKLYKKNRLHEAIGILTRLKHHGYDLPLTSLTLAMTYDKVAYLSGDKEYEDMALEEYDEIINYRGSKKYRKKAIKLQNSLAKRISLLNENEYKAQVKAKELQNSSPRSAKSWFMLGANFAVRKDPFFVINAFENALKLNPDYILALYRLGYIYHHNLNDIDAALKYYLRVIKINPFEDTTESESINIKAVIETCNELSDIYMKKRQLNRVLSVCDYTLKFFHEYNDMCSSESLKNIIDNSYKAARRLEKSDALKKYIFDKYKLDFDSMLRELRIV